ncbi:galactose-specific lectin nattectin-like isoform 2-T2 [Synchiropus picturatus]
MAKGLTFVVFLFGLWIGANAQYWSDFRDCPSCPPGWTKYGERCYMYNASAAEWADAEAACIRKGGNLVSYHNQGEYDFILSVIKRSSGKDTRIWVGGQDATKNKVWLWSDGSIFDFQNWGRGQPNNAQGKEHCMELNFFGKPNDHLCHIKKPFMCVRDQE